MVRYEVWTVCAQYNVEQEANIYSTVFVQHPHIHVYEAIVATFGGGNALQQQLRPISVFYMMHIIIRKNGSYKLKT